MTFFQLYGQITKSRTVRLVSIHINFEFNLTSFSGESL